MTSLALITGSQSFESFTDAEGIASVARFVVYPALLAAWWSLGIRRRRERTTRWDWGKVLPLAMTAWFALGAFLAEDRIGSLARAAALCLLILISVAVLGPSLGTTRFATTLFAAGFLAALVTAVLAAIAPLVSSNPNWGLLGNRYYGPLSATRLGPICAVGWMAGYAFARTAPRRRIRLLAFVGIFLLLAMTVISRARGSYLCLGVGMVIFFVLSRRSGVVRRIGMVAAVGGVLAVGAWGWSVTVTDSSFARFLRLDQEDMVAQRVDIWRAMGTLWLERPLFGVGLGNEAELSEFAKRSHSVVLSTLNEGGLPGLLLLLGALAVASTRALRLALSPVDERLRLVGTLALAVIVGNFVLGFVETTFINAASTSNMYLWLVAGAAMAAANDVNVHRQLRRPTAPTRRCVSP